MEYKIHKNKKGECKIQRRKGWFNWEWLDACEAWCNWFGKDRPFLFATEKEAKEYIDRLEFKTITYYP